VNTPLTPVYVRTQRTQVPSRFRQGLIIDHLLAPRPATLDADFRPIYRTCGLPPDAALDLLLLSSSVYVADKKVLRSEQPDCWTRQFEIHVPVHHPRRWQAIGQLVEQTLSYLTGDLWSVRFRSAGDWPFQPGLRLTNFSSSTAVCLFSGGLDSTIGAINLLEGGRRLLLVGHYDNNHTKKDQRRVFELLSTHYGDQIIDLLQLRVRPAPQRKSQEASLPAKTEKSVRSRSALFLALGLLTSSAISPDTELFVPENGFTSLNVPLTASRRGSNSTRTTHPHFVDQMAAILSHIGVMNPVRYPLSFDTKGEIVQHCGNLDVLKRVLRFTISCAHAEILRFEKKDRGNCGYCYPCIVRRAALHKAALDDPRDYGWDVCKETGLLEAGVRGNDAKAIFMALDSARHSSPTLLWLTAAGPIRRPPSELRRLRDVYLRGLAEIESLFRDKATVEVLRLAGLETS
jgi:7-cyano-7-deazaguanine synthase in queuosine biosynthesis